MMRLRHFALPTIFWLFVAYLFIPIIVMAAMGFRDSNFVAFPIQSWTTRWYQSVLFDKDIAQSLWLSLKVAVVSTLIALAVGLPSAFLVARTTGIIRAALVAIIVLPAFLPVIVSAIALRMFIGQLGLETGPTAIAIGHAASTIPFVVLMVLTRLNAMNPNIADAARNLGADDVIVFTRIILPYLAPALFGAVMFAMLLSFEDFVRSFFLGGFEQTFPVLLFSKLRFGLDPGLAAISTLVLLVSTAIGLYADHFLRRRRMKNGITS